MTPNPPSRKYNIAFLIDGLGMGGAERMMIPILKQLRGEDFEPRVAVFQAREGNPIAKDLQALGITVDYFPIPYLRDVGAVLRLVKYFKQTKTDLVHTQLELADSLGSIASKWARLPSVSTLHTMPSQDMRLKSWAHQTIEFWSLRLFCDRVISVAEEARQYHLKISGAPEKQNITIYNGIDLTRFAHLDGTRDALRRELGIPSDAEVLTTLAVLRQPKGIQFMIQAMPAVLEARPKAVYLVAGDGSHRAALEEEARRAGVDRSVIFAGMRSDVPRILAASDVFVLPTLTEALPTVLAEAMACRLPIVASAVGGVPEMVTDGENGKLVQPARPDELSRACVELLSNPALREQMSRRGWEIVNDKFNVKGQVERLKELYRGLIKQYGR
ncbi:MAG: glycosyltransferase [Chloroflexi bacterium]|nr:glycosyltransferase [Chloroflexota bacterium]